MIILFTIAGIRLPAGCGRGSIATTSPLAGAWAAVEPNLLFEGLFQPIIVKDGEGLQTFVVER